MSGLDILKESLSASVLEWMKIRGLNQDQLAANTKFSPADICKAIRKQKNFTMSSLDELAGGFNCTARIVFVPKKACDNSTLNT